MLLWSCGESGDEGEIVGCPGGFEVTARDFRAQTNCGVLLEKEDGTLLAIVNFGEFPEPIVDGADYIVITEQLINAPTPCMGALLHLLLCIERK